MDENLKQTLRKESNNLFTTTNQITHFYKPEEQTDNINVSCKEPNVAYISNPINYFYETTNQKEHNYKSHNTDHIIHKKPPSSTKLTYTGDAKDKYIEQITSQLEESILGLDNQGNISLVHPRTKYISETNASFRKPNLSSNIKNNYNENVDYLVQQHENFTKTMMKEKEDRLKKVNDTLNYNQSTTKLIHDNYNSFPTKDPQTIIFRDAQLRGKVKSGTVSSGKVTIDKSNPEPHHLVDELKIVAKGDTQHFSHVKDLGITTETKEQYKDLTQKEIDFTIRANEGVLRERNSSIEKTGRIGTLEKDENNNFIDRYETETKSKFKSYVDYKREVTQNDKVQIFNYPRNAVNLSSFVKKEFCKPVNSTLDNK
ncbi:hypothetical protein ABK040_005429 [Willaertia magna]